MRYSLALIALFIVSLFLTPLFGQDTLVKEMFSLPEGIYYSERSFFAKKPDLVTNFTLVPTRENYPENATGYGLTFKVADSVKLPPSVYGLYDGENVYIRIDDGIRSSGSNIYVSRTLVINEYFKLARTGRHPYIFISPGPILKLESVYTVSPEDSTFNKRVNRLSLYYVSKKKKMIRASPAAIGFLLKADKDLYNEYQQETTVNNEIMRKYLDKMNDRYPNWETSSE